MRIVGGKYRGRNLVAFDGDKIRPTSDKVRESVFNILQFGLSGADFLDLFSGSGAMGIEALSRGVNSVTFNDFSRDSIAVLKKNLEKIKVDGNYTVKNLDAVTFVKNCTNKFDIIYIDPPYKSDLGLKVLPFIAELLKDEGVAIFEDEKPFSQIIDNLIITDQRKYGRVYLTFFKKG